MTTQAKPVPHVHAEVIKAWADGHIIEYRFEGDSTWAEIGVPQWNANTQYRVKPEVQPDITAKGQFYYDPRMTDNWDCAYTPDVNNVQFTFCGETHKLIKVELIEEGNE